MGATLLSGFLKVLGCVANGLQRVPWLNKGVARGVKIFFAKILAKCVCECEYHITGLLKLSIIVIIVMKEFSHKQHSPTRPPHECVWFQVRLFTNSAKPYPTLSLFSSIVCSSRLPLRDFDCH